MVEAGLEIAALPSELEPEKEPAILLRVFITDWSPDQLASIVNAANIEGFGVHFEQSGEYDTLLQIDGEGDHANFFATAAELLARSNNGFSGNGHK